MLDTIGFVWSSKSEQKWDEMYDRLRRYHAEHGNADVPDRWKANPELGRWVSVQRQRRKKGAISEVEVQLLNELGITWKSRDVGTWEDRLAEVAAFKAKHGHCDIPLNYPGNRKLGRFVNNTRSQRNGGKLAADRITKLDAIGFVWNSTRAADLRVGEDGINRAWKDVPRNWSENSPLAHWVITQRQRKRLGKLNPEYERLLNEAGFNWAKQSPRKQ